MFKPAELINQGSYRLNLITPVPVRAHFKPLHLLGPCSVMRARDLANSSHFDTKGLQLKLTWTMCRPQCNHAMFQSSCAILICLPLSIPCSVMPARDQPNSTRFVQWIRQLKLPVGMCPPWRNIALLQSSACSDVSEYFFFESSFVSLSGFCSENFLDGIWAIYFGQKELPPVEQVDQLCAQLCKLPFG